jgi:S1-C subfamily serine protease
MSTVTDHPTELQNPSAGAAPGTVQPRPPRRGGWGGGRIVPFVVVALLGGAAGGGIVAAFDHDGTTTTTASPAATLATPAAAVPATAVATGGTKTIEQIYKAAAPGVVQVNQGNAEGSGFVLDRQGHVVTNAHVVTNGGPVTVSFSNDDRVPATVVGFDNSTDVALLKVTAPSSALVPLPLGDSSTLQVGDGVVAIGNPFGLDRSATSGIVSALNREITSPNGFGINGVIQTDAAINHGNSGGPLLNLQGQVVGINSQIADSGVDANVGVGFTIPIDTVKQITRDLAASGSISHAYLGVQLAPVDPTIAAEAKLPVSHGAMISGIDGGSPAASAGLRAATRTSVIDGTTYGIGGDIITAVDGKPVTSPEDVQTAIGALRAGDRIALSVVRADGSKTTISLTAGLQPKTSPALQGQQP